MGNPIEAVIKSTGKSRKSLAVEWGVNYYLLGATLRGFPTRIPRSLREVLGRLGFDVEKLENQYEAWRRTLNR